jgi:hypothetical protein
MADGDDVAVMTPCCCEAATAAAVSLAPPLNGEVFAEFRCCAFIVYVTVDSVHNIIVMALGCLFCALDRTCFGLRIQGGAQ